MKNPPASSSSATPEKMGLWIETACEWLGVEAQATTVAYAEIERMLRSGAPAVLRCPVGDDVLYFGLLGARRGNAVLLGPGGEVMRVPLERIRDWFCARVERPLEAEVTAVLAVTGVPARRVERTRRAILAQRLAGARIGGFWLLRPGSTATFRSQLRQARIIPRLIALGFSHALQYGLWILSWWTIGFGALAGRIDPGLLLLWIVMVLSLVPFRMATTWLQGSISIRGGALVKQRLLSGALRLVPEEIRHQGAGQLLARVLESEALESLALSGGFLLLLGGIELLMAAAVLATGAGGVLHASLLLVWSLLAYVAGRRYFDRRLEWTDQRLDLTHALVESMLGYRTRLAQEPRRHWHENEDRQLVEYARLSSRLDQAATAVSSLMSRGWLLLGVATLGPALITGNATPARVAISLGGLLLSYRAMSGFTAGMVQLHGASIAWRKTAELFRAASRPELRSEPDLVVSDILTLAPTLAAEVAGVPHATLIPHVYPVQQPGMP
ncbi:MAG: ABC transporter ATP-binding protein, partial [Acidobacteria bacterium]|nr:ABC transporter ATP-binding protein [Acidobacteriota bacterium]